MLTILGKNALYLLEYIFFFKSFTPDKLVVVSLCMRNINFVVVVDSCSCGWLSLRF